MQMKERKEMEDLYKKAQKPWAKLLSKVEKTKADYHAACKTEKTATNQERNACADTSISQDQVQVRIFFCLNWNSIEFLVIFVYHYHCVVFDYDKKNICTMITR